MITPSEEASRTAERLRHGMVIPAHPLALTDDGAFDEKYQRALTRYYHAAGAGGVAVGVHTTQFEIRDPKHGLLEPVLELASETIDRCDQETKRQSILIAGICGPTRQAIVEAELARRFGYHAGLVSLAAFGDASDTEMLDHCRALAEVVPIMGFYLQPAAGGRLLSESFWRQFAEIPNVVGIKIAPFNRYQTLDVLRAVAESGRADFLALYTGNDDQIVPDLLTEFSIGTTRGMVPVHFSGGLLGQWACWTQQAVAILEKCREAREVGKIPDTLLTLGAQLTETNAAIFDVANRFAGCIPGIHYVLKRQGLLRSMRCLNPEEVLSPGQAERIERVRHHYPALADDAFVQEHLDRWLH